jgi:predicted  nucleic acid-binding Zn-ribbon protein
MSTTRKTPSRRIISTEPTIQNVLDEVEDVNRNIGSIQTELERIKLALEALQKAVGRLEVQ